MSGPVRVAITLTLVPVLAAALSLGLESTIVDTSGLLLPGVASATAAPSYLLLRRADTPWGWAIGGALLASLLCYALAFAMLIEFFLD
jgi:hypothetical protein